MAKKLLSIGYKCNGCNSCQLKCPKDCIKMCVDAEGFWYPKVDGDICIDCGLCEKICPVLNKSTNENESDVALAVINKNTDIREQSSSGGVFYLLAENIIKNGGVVFGAAFTQDFKSVEHICVKDIESLPKLMGSKYLQSKIGEVYITAKQYLDDGKKVLFSGTPCQIGGLYSYLGRDYENLITQDLICHGVPSPMVWKKYVEYREKKSASKTRRTFFRHKKYGWKTFSVQFVFENCTEYIQIIRDDLYMRGFLADLYLRPSCYDCSFKSTNRISDITLADFWGIENVCPDMFDDKGTSLVLLNTEKAEAVFDSIKADSQYCYVDKSHALMYNSAAAKCPVIPQNRKLFMRDFQTMPFEKLIKKHCKVKFKTKIKRFLRKINNFKVR